MRYLDNINLTQKQEKLRDRLLSIWKDEEFVLGVLVYTDTDEKVDYMFQFIDNKKNITPSEITLESLYLEDLDN
mgnify:CR=1 FL=1